MPAVGHGDEALADAPWESERITDPGLPAEHVASADEPVLVRMDGCEAGSLYRLDGRQCRVGRATENEIVVNDVGVSRQHARLTNVDGRCVVEDTESRNGTYVRGRRVHRAELETGDVIQLGLTVTLSYQRLSEQQRELLQQLYESSTRDGLTGLCNRRHFGDRLAAEVAFSRRHGTALGLVLIDIDHFKTINDRFGHAAGDAVLRQLGPAMKRQLRTEDIIARIGGEEFAVILRGIAIEGCARLADRLRGVVAATQFLLDTAQLPVTISLGCASLRGAETTAAVLNRLADARLYEAKRQGRNRVVATGCGRDEVGDLPS
jgi:diguanylate cyclase (GGDEF)-like protein